MAALMAVASPAVAGDWCGRSGSHLPDAVQRALPGLELRGEGQLRWFGLIAYRARLWTQRGVEPGRPLALEILYARNFRGQQLAERSVDEMRHTGAGTDAQRQRWAAAMASTFRDVGPGDCILAAALGDGTTEFFINGTALGTIADPEFGRAFFGIWLSPATSQPVLRSQLLGTVR